VNGAVGLQVRAAGAVVAQRQPDQPHYAASTMKLAVLGALLRAQAAGGFPDQLMVTDDFVSADGGRFQIIQADDQDDLTWSCLGRSVRVDRLAERMIVLSSNLATDLLLEQLGLAAVDLLLAEAGLTGQVVVRRLIGDARAEAHGISNTVTAAGVARRLIGDARAEAHGISNTVTAAGLARLLETLTDGSLLGEANAAVAAQILAGQTHREMIPAGLPAGTWSASKGGWVDGVNHDVALVRPGTAPDYILAICTSTGLSHDAGCALVAELSRITWEHWKQWHS